MRIDIFPTGSSLENAALESGTEPRLPPESRDEKVKKKFFRLHKSVPVPVQEWGERPRAYMSRVLYELLLQEGLRWKNHQVHDEQVHPTEEELFEHLLEWVDRGGHRGFTDKIVFGSDYEIAMGNAEKKGCLSWYAVERLCRNATERVEEFWNPEFTLRLRERASKGGRAYRTYTVEDYLETLHMKPTEAARNRGWKHTKTVYRMRAHFEKLIDPATGEVSDEYPS